jgi:hypothetical protein
MKKDENRYASKPFSVWTYTLPGDWTVMAGKTDADNDRLSLVISTFSSKPSMA